MTRRIAVAMASLAAVIVLILGIPMIMVFKDAGTRSLRTGLERDALVLATDLSALDNAEWTRRVMTYAAGTGAGVTVVDSTGKVVYDSEGSSPGGELAPPEMTAALAGVLVNGTRRVSDGDESLQYAAVPVTHGRETLGALRLSIADRAVDETVARIEWMLFATLGLVLVITTLVAWLVARVIARPLRLLAQSAREIGTDPHTLVEPVHGPAEVRQVADALSETGAELAAALDRSRAVAEEASHHLRTPLAALRLRVEALGDATEGRTRCEAEAALVEVDRLARRIDQILAMAAEPTTDAHAVDVAAAVRQRLGYWRTFAEEQGITIVDELRPAVIRHQLGTVERTLDELIGNALNYAETDIRVGLWTDQDAVMLLVWDDGPGVPRADREAVFGRFRRGSTARPGGSGLGLALVRESARLIGGDAMIIESERGAAVQVRWPSAAREAAGPDVAPAVVRR